MLYFIVYMMSVLAPSGDHQFYIYTEPVFSSKQSCEEFVIRNAEGLAVDVYKHYGPDNPPKLVACLTQEDMRSLDEPKKKPSLSI
jgi:hypothetical protein